MMVITKDWLQEKIKNSKEQVSNNVKLGNTELGNLELGRFQAFEECFKKLTEPPTKKVKEKKFDGDKAYESIVRYYMDKKGYTKEHANEIAKHAVSEQQARLT